MLPLPQEYVGSICELKSLDNRLIAVGRMIKIDHDALEIAAAEDEYMQLIQYRLPVKIHVHSQHGNRVLVGITYLSTDRFTRLEEVKPLQDFERRGAFRVNSGVKGTLSPLISAAQQHAYDEKIASLSPEDAKILEEKTFYHVSVVDISLTGVRLSSPKPLRELEQFILTFQPVKAPMSLHIKVERLIRMPDDSLQYGCSFVDITDRQSDVLCRDLFTLQRLEKSRRDNTVRII